MASENKIGNIEHSRDFDSGWVDEMRDDIGNITKRKYNTFGNPCKEHYRNNQSEGI